MTEPAAGAIVLLEDDDLDAELVVERLRAEGVDLEVRRVSDEASFRAHVAAPGVALVLSDYNLPGYDGLAALDTARQLAPDVPFLFVSGAIGEEMAIDVIRRGATDYVLKHRLERLAPAVRRALAEAETRRRRDAAEAERDRLLASERAAREAAEDANRMKDDFLAVVSHELRTPLNAILGWASLLHGPRPPDGATQRRGLDAIVRNARIQKRLIEDILDISRVVSGKLHLHLDTVEVETFVAAAVEAVRPAVSAKAIALEVRVDPSAGRMVADGERLQQVVWNLVANAVKFTPQGGAVVVAARRSGGTVVVEVSDTGSGIDPDLLPFVFDRFRQGDGSKTRAHGGLGLGLAIVRHLVEMHGGTIVAASDGPGRGATFTVSLPVRAVGPAPEAPASAARPVASADDVAAGPPRSLTGTRVLVVDDERDARDLVEEVLRASGATVITRATADDALAAVDGFRPDVVISDIGMPDVDGYTFLRRLRSMPSERGGAVPAIALTAYAGELDRAEAARAGFQLHLAKPIAPDVLVEAVRRTLGAAADVA